MPQVLHVVPYLDPSAGGPPVVVTRLAGLAPENCFSAQILTSAAYTDDGGTALVEAGNVVLKRQRNAFLGDFAQVTKAIATADIVHLHTMWSPLVAAAGYAAHQMGVPTVVSPHGMLEPWSLKQKMFRKRLWLALVERRNLKLAARILFTTEAERDQSINACGVMPQSAVVSLGADIPPRSREILAAEFAEHHPDLASRTLLIFLGRLHAKKRPDAVIRALPKIREVVPNATLLIAGSGEFRNELEALVKLLKLTGAVHFLGQIAGDDKWRALAASRLFVLPSWQENFGIAVAESLATGVPVVLAHGVNIAEEIVSAGAGRLVSDTKTEHDIAYQVISLLLDPASLALASEKAKDLAIRRFSWSVSVAATHNLYSQVIAERNEGGLT